eukprot:6455995-Amphidinium_carterae.1
MSVTSSCDPALEILFTSKSDIATPDECLHAMQEVRKWHPKFARNGSKFSIYFTFPMTRIDCATLRASIWKVGHRTRLEEQLVQWSD